jgi:hypothetical protein
MPKENPNMDPPYRITEQLGFPNAFNFEEKFFFVGVDGNNNRSKQEPKNHTYDKTNNQYPDYHILRS